ncbi:FAD/FMN-containing dehydrogenase [Pustulibacterium marinum]|uniref:FAD/FMN-containing dehydrogenase n=1 Tax=Pustulibacterium marinum TaxID=1224947 RepID=A0A1I7IEE9_9FLAO|nr:FAD-binding and (Fe-S)-binding domain-containing protein [Pustulibacterium marinum]SFU71278.1 FAD/FMN-containing dehydrogenase [Pustulibacterium marinum]
MIPKKKSKNPENISNQLYNSDLLSRTIYATDASVYKELPEGVAFPKNIEDLKELIAYANNEKIGLIPRAAGTSLAGQCVGKGIVVDMSKYFTKILHIDEKNRTVTLEPGIVRDELNSILKSYGLFFAPNTSTSNRCTIGGMVGNNSSGTTSIRYGVTRDKVLEMDVLLSDGSLITIKPLTKGELLHKMSLPTLEGKIYKNIVEKLSAPEVQNEIKTEFPKSSIHRRNTGYAVDMLLDTIPFQKEGGKFNLCKLLAGSEGTLAFTTSITLQLDKLPPRHKVMIAAHFISVEDCCKAVAPVMNHHLYTCEMMDKVILDCTKNNKQQAKNREFVEGDPQAILMLELSSDSESDLENQCESLIQTITSETKAYAYPLLLGEKINNALELRKAGLGLLGNLVGDRKAVACIEDTAVALEDLSNYIEEFTQLMDDHHQQAVYYAHAGAGELHLRPILNLKKAKDVALFRQITTDVAKLVKKYQGSMSGEHGDGRVRAEFIELMIGEKNYHLLKGIKQLFDPENIFNPGKIIDAAPMDMYLRNTVNKPTEKIKTALDFSDSLGIIRAAEKCNGSGDCRKSHQFDGAMCPSFQATKNEKDTTRARANALREFLNTSEKENKFDQPELKEVFDLCLSCKACGSECPSSVDASLLKSEFLYQYHKVHPHSFRDKIFAKSGHLNKMASRFPGISNTVFKSNLLSSIIKKPLGIASQRSLPPVCSFDLEKFNEQFMQQSVCYNKVILFIDEFSNFNDALIARDSLEVLYKLGFCVELYFGESGRTFISKGFLEEAKEIAKTNIRNLKNKVTPKIPLLGIEPSAILSFRDEYPRLVEYQDEAKTLAGNSFLIEEFLAKEIANGAIKADMFTNERKRVKIHSHCYQKALSNQKVTFDMLNVIPNYKVSIMNTGCCGMAGSFGYEKEHYEVSMQIGNLKLFPAIEKSHRDVVIAANGTSCRHQIFDGTGRTAQHPISIFKEALL